VRLLQNPYIAPECFDNDYLQLRGAGSNLSCNINRSVMTMKARAEALLGTQTLMTFQRVDGLRFPLNVIDQFAASICVNCGNVSGCRSFKGADERQSSIVEMPLTVAGRYQGRECAWEYRALP
jgi:hypothetical protein